MFALLKKEIMIVVFMAISFLLGSFGSSEALVEPKEESQVQNYTFSSIKNPVL
jgi:capsular polysaccharide biosynthesis protein